MPYHFGLVVRIYPDYQQKHIIAQNDGAARFVYNRLVAMNNERFQMKKVSAVVPAYAERIDYLDSVLRNKVSSCTIPKMLKNSAPFLFEKDIDSLAIENAVRNYNNAWKKFKEDHRAGVPKFHKKGYEQSYQTNAHYRADAIGINDSNVRFLDRKHVQLPILGRIRIAGSRERIESIMFRNETRIGTITISRDSVGRYFASFQIASEYPLYPPYAHTGAAVGIDLNIENFLWDSDNNRVDNPQYKRAVTSQLAKRQRKMSRKAERARKENRKLAESKNYQKDRLRVAYLHAKVAGRSEDFRHIVSKQYVESQDIIVVENLKVSNLLKNHRLAFCISEVGWSDFLRKLEYKAAANDRIFIKVSPHNTSQTCSCCGHVLSKDRKLTLSDREWVCPQCGAYHVRDHNAAQVILDRGLASLAD